MDFFSGKNPDLIGPTMKSTLNEIMNKPQINNSTISEKITNVIINFYNDYIYEHMFVVIIIIIIITCLIFRYYDKKNKKESFVLNESKSKKQNKDLIEEIKDYNFDDELDAQPNATSPPAGYMYMNPTNGINKQENELVVAYPPDKLPVNDNGNIIFTRNLYKNPVADEPLNAPDYDYDNVYKNKSRTYYSGAYNTYKNSQDTNIENPLGFSNKFNTTMGNFVGQMTDKNLQSVLGYQTIADNIESNLIAGASGNSQRFFPEFEKPYEEY
jgi:hypothetical protein